MKAKTETKAAQPGSVQRIVRRQIVAKFTAEQGAAMWTLLDSTMCAQEDRREILKWKRLRDKFRLPAKAKRGNMKMTHTCAPMWR